MSLAKPFNLDANRMLRYLLQISRLLLFFQPHDVLSSRPLRLASGLLSAFSILPKTRTVEAHLRTTRLDSLPNYLRLPLTPFLLSCHIIKPRLVLSRLTGRAISIYLCGCLFCALVVAGLEQKSCNITTASACHATHLGRN